MPTPLTPMGTTPTDATPTPDATPAPDVTQTLKNALKNVKSTAEEKTPWWHVVTNLSNKKPKNTQDASADQSDLLKDLKAFCEKNPKTRSCDPPMATMPREDTISFFKDQCKKGRAFMVVEVTNGNPPALKEPGLVMYSNGTTFYQGNSIKEVQDQLSQADLAIFNDKLQVAKDQLTATKPGAAVTGQAVDSTAGQTATTAGTAAAEEAARPSYVADVRGLNKYFDTRSCCPKNVAMMSAYCTAVLTFARITVQ